MSETTELADLYAAIEESARLLKVPYSHEKVRSILAPYQEVLPDTSIAFRMGTSQRYSGDVDWRFSVPADGVDPYTTAVADGLIEHTDHPISSLFGEVAQRCTASFYGVDFGAAGELKKLYVAFPPDDMEPLSTLLDLPSMPRSVADNYEFFARHGMDGKQMPMFGIDYRDRTVNLYFSGLSAGTLAPHSTRSIFRDLELPEPSEQLLKLAAKAFGFYATVGWDSPKVERSAFSLVATDPADLPVPMAPEIADFLAGVRRQAAEDTFLYYVAMSATGEEIYKFQAYYRFKPWLNPMLRSGSAEQGS